MSPKYLCNTQVVFLLQIFFASWSDRRDRLHALENKLHIPGYEIYLGMTESPLAEYYKNSSHPTKITCLRMP